MSEKKRRQEQEEVWFVMCAIQVSEVTQDQKKKEKAAGKVSANAQKGRVDKAAGKFLEGNMARRYWVVGLRKCALQSISLFHARGSTAFLSPIVTLLIL